MVYACKVDWFFDDEITNDEVFIVADSLSSCMELIEEHYGEDEIELVIVEPIASGYMMPICDDSTLFESVKDNIKEQAIW